MAKMSEIAEKRMRDKICGLVKNKGTKPKEPSYKNGKTELHSGGMLHAERKKK